MVKQAVTMIDKAFTQREREDKMIDKEVKEDGYMEDM